MNPWRGLGELPKEVWLLFITTLINRAGQMAMPFLVLYLTQHQRLSASRAGLVITVYGIGALITSPLAGRLCDHIGAQRVMKLSLLLTGALLLLFPLAHDYVTILLLTFLWAVVSEAFRPASMVVNTEAVAPEKRKTAFAVYRLAANLGMSIGPLAGGLLATVSFPALFIVDGVTTLLAGAVLFAAAWKNPALNAPKADKAATADHHSTSLPARSLLTHFSFLWFLLAMIPVQMVFFQHSSTMALFLVRDLRLSEATYGMLFTVNTLLIVLLEIPLNLRMERWSHRAAMSLGALLSAIGFGALMFVNDVRGVAATVVVWTFGEMILFPSSAAYAGGVAPAARRGVYLGVYQMTFSLSFALGPLLGTRLLEQFGARTLWLTTLLVGLLSTVMLASVAPEQRWSETTNTENQTASESV